MGLWSGFDQRTALKSAARREEMCCCHGYYKKIGEVGNIWLNSFRIAFDFFFFCLFGSCNSQCKRVSIKVLVPIRSEAV